MVMVVVFVTNSRFDDTIWWSLVTLHFLSPQSSGRSKIIKVF